MTTALATAGKKEIIVINAFDTSILAGTKSPNTIEQYEMHFAAYLSFVAAYQPTEEELADEKNPFPVGIRGRMAYPPMLARWRKHLFEVGYTTGSEEKGNLTHKAYSVNAINQRLAAIRGVMAAAKEQGFITSSVADAFKSVRGLTVKANKDRRNQHTRTRITKTDMQRIVNAPDATKPAGLMHRALLMTLATGGMRISEAVTLKVSQIEWMESVDDNGNPSMGWVVNIAGKNQVDEKPRALADKAKHAIDAWLKVRKTLGIESEYIFTSFGGSGSRNPTGNPITRMSAWQMVKRYAEKLGLDHIKPHDFRRYVGTQLAKTDIRLAQNQLGHKRIETTVQNYVLDSVQLGTTNDLV